MEKFTIIKEFDNYAVSNFGRIMNIQTKQILKQWKTKTGYLSYMFCQNGKKKTFRVHRLVAMYFLENPFHLPYVNHRDGDKTNNNVDNLEWCTAKENDEHARENGLKEQNKPVICEDIKTKEKQSFISVSEASAFLGINKGSICKVLQGRRNQVHGYAFSYL